MLPVTVPASRGDAAHLDAGRRVSPALLALDEHLFNPDASQWLVIDSGNTAVPRTVVPSLVDGLELIGKGRIAALVGHLRDGVGVVDIDVPGDFGTFLAAEIADWLRRRDCWVLERPSGGAKGRWHIFFAHSDFHYAPAAARAGFAAAVSDYLTALAEDVKVPRGELDLRDAVRPLSSPHRFGAVTRPKGDLREALRGVKRLLPDPPSPSPLRPRAKVKPADAGRRSTATARAWWCRWRCSGGSVSCAPSGAITADRRNPGRVVGRRRDEDPRRGRGRSIPRRGGLQPGDGVGDRRPGARPGGSSVSRTRGR